MRIRRLGLAPIQRHNAPYAAAKRYTCVQLQMRIPPELSARVTLEMFAELYKKLESLHELDYLTCTNDACKVMQPITIVATVNAPFSFVTALLEDHRNIFLDAHLEVLSSVLDDSTVSPPVFK